MSRRVKNQKIVEEYLEKNTSFEDIGTVARDIAEKFNQSGEEDIVEFIVKKISEGSDEGSINLTEPKKTEPVEDKAEKGTTHPLSKLDWKKYLEENPELIALNKQMAKKYGLIESEMISKAKEQKILSELKDDNLKILLLQFFKDISHLEGFHSITYSPIGNASEEYAGFSCKIGWNNGQTTSGIGDAHKNNTTSFTKYYLGPIAENRSFVRAVKAYFNIPIIGKDEIGDVPEEDPKKEESAPIGPHVTLQRIAKEKLSKPSFEGFKAFLGEQVKKDASSAWIQPEEYDEWKGYTDWGDIKKPKILELITKVKNL